MSVGFIVLARMDSARLPGKPLHPILGKPALAHLVQGLRDVGSLAGSTPPVVVATTTRTVDDPLERFARENGLEVFRGGLDDVAGRCLGAARASGLDWFFRVNGDNLLLLPHLFREFAQRAVRDDLDLVSNVPERTFPKGMSVELIRTGFLEAHLDGFREDDREHVTPWFYRNPELGRRHLEVNREWPSLAGRQLALDSPADARVLEFLLRHLGEVSSGERLQALDELLGRYTPAQPWTGAHGPLLVAEIGGNHEGDFGRAMELIERALEVRPDFVKFQIYTGDSLVSPVASPQRHGHFQTFELSPEKHLQLANRCREEGVGYMASVWDPQAFSWVDEVTEIYKVGSGDLTATPVLRQTAALGRPILLSTGLSTEDEVVQAVETLGAVDPSYREPHRLALLQCTSMYPIPPREANLGVMARLASLSGLPVGYSDHTEGTLALKVAAAMGARVLEFHFTDQRAGKVFRDHKVSLEPHEVAELQDYLDAMVAVQGGGVKRAMPAELESGHVETFRRALYPARDLPRGHLMQEADLVALRPNEGLDAREFDKLVGRRTLRDLKAATPLTWDDFSNE